MNLLCSVMRQINNYFETGYVEGNLEIKSGRISCYAALDGDGYIAVQGRKNRGVYEVSATGYVYGAEDEKFNGRVWILHPTEEFLEIVQNIEQYKEKNPVGAFVSESFGGWSGTRASGQHGAVTWQEAFADELKPFRRMYTEVEF